MPLKLTQYDVISIFTYHPPNVNQTAKYEVLREKARDLSLLIWGSCPDSREKSLAITHLQECVMMANASIAIHEADLNQKSEFPPFNTENAGETD